MNAAERAAIISAGARSSVGGDEEQAPVGATVPATLSLTLGTPATFGAFTPGVAREYTASTTANVISTAGDATLTVSDPAATRRPPGQRRVQLAAAAAGRTFAPGDGEDRRRCPTTS